MLTFGENLRFHSRRFLFVLCVCPVINTTIDEVLIFVNVGGRLLSNAGRLSVQVLIDIEIKLLLNLLLLDHDWLHLPYLSRQRGASRLILARSRFSCS